MNIRAIEHNYKVKVTPANVVIDRLKSRLAKLENKYHLTSEEMIAKVQQDPTYETEEICVWLHDYRTLQMVANGHGRISTGGTHTKTTNKSTIPV